MTDRAREGLFSSLAAMVGGTWVLDLYAGSGSIGLEALSRGAAAAVFVERDRRALAALRRNVEGVGLGGDVVADDVERYLSRSGGRFDLAFVDPPYDLALPSVDRVLGLLVPRLEIGAVVVLHRRHGSGAPTALDSMIVIDRRRYGDSELTRFERQPDKEDMA